MKYTLTLEQNAGFCNNPRFAELEGACIALNNVLLPKHIDADSSYNPYNVGLYVIGNEHGAICAVWAGHAQEAFDEACDANLIDSLMSDEQDYDDEALTPLGNASELFDLTHAWCARVEFDAARDIHLIVAIVRAAENQQTVLEE